MSKGNNKILLVVNRPTLYAIKLLLAKTANRMVKFFSRLNKIGKQNPNLPDHLADHDGEDDDGSPDMTAIVSALAQQQQRASE